MAKVPCCAHSKLSQTYQKRCTRVSRGAILPSWNQTAGTRRKHTMHRPINANEYESFEYDSDDDDYLTAIPSSEDELGYSAASEEDMAELISQEEPMPREVELMREYGLQLGSLLQNPTWKVEETDSDDDAEWTPALGFEEEVVPKTEAEKEWEAQLNHQVAARQRWETEQAEEQAFVLHHGQMQRSFNPYQTTLRYADVLEVLSYADDKDPRATGIPLWIRANFIFEESFDAWNDMISGSSTGFASPSTGLENDILELADKDPRFSGGDSGDTKQKQVETSERQAPPRSVVAGPAATADSGRDDDLDSLADVFPSASAPLAPRKMYADEPEAPYVKEKTEEPVEKDNVIDF